MIDSRDVTLNMHSVQTMGKHRDEQKRQCRGKWFLRDGINVVKYRDEDSGTIDTMELYTRRVRLRRSGAINAEMEFTAGGSSLFDMATELGTFDFLVRTTRVAVGIFEDHLSVALAYDLYADGALVSHNHVDYEVVLCEE
ncbi:MAG: DUF1934 domain-containing protein [Lachnospiraceae bacterium]|nr:DUF1934 domain-containing protein [Lachnospiraceae bacterium]